MASQLPPQTMRAVVHKQDSQSLQFVPDYKLPTPASDQYLLKVEASGITTGELYWPRGPGLNESIPGVEMAGTIAATPSASKAPKFKIGDQVYMRTTYPRAGSASEYSLGAESELANRPRNISAVEAASVPVSALTAWQGLFHQLKLAQTVDRSSSAPRILVIGASGGVGLFYVQLAHWAGYHVVGVCSTKNVGLVQSLGADDVIDYHKESFLTWVQSHGKFEVVLVCVGGDSGRDAWHAVKDGGKLLSIVPPKDMDFSKWDLQTPEDVSTTVKGKFFIMEAKGEDLEEVTKLIEGGKVKPVIDSVWELEEYDKAFERLDSGRAVGKVVFRCSNVDSGL